MQAPAGEARAAWLAPFDVRSEVEEGGHDVGAAGLAGVVERGFAVVIDGVGVYVGGAQHCLSRPNHGEITASPGLEAKGLIRPPDWSRGFCNQLAGSVVIHLGSIAGQCLRRDGGSDGNGSLAVTKGACWICVVQWLLVTGRTRFSGDGGGGGRGRGRGRRRAGSGRGDAGPGRGAGRELASTTGGAGLKYRGLPHRCHTPRTSDGAGRRRTPRRPAPAPAPGRHPRLRLHTCMRRRQRARAGARVATARRAGRVAHCSFVKVYCNWLSFPTFRCARKPPGRRDSERAVLLRPLEAVILRPHASPKGSARHCPRRPARQCLGSVEHCPSTNQEAG